jgi:hypothetical protein
MKTAPITAESSANVIQFPTPASEKFEVFRERWLRQIALDKELPAGALRLCIVMSTFLNRHSRDAWPGMARLAKETGLSRRWIVDLTQLVERRGHWRVTRTRVGPKNNLLNRYHLTCTTVHHPSEVASSLGGSEVATSPEPLSVEPLNEPLPNGRGCATPQGNTEVRTTQVKRVAEEEREASLTPSDNPFLPNKRKPPKAEVVRGFEALRGTLGLCRDPLDRDGAAAISPDAADLVTR